MTDCSESDWNMLKKKNILPSDSDSFISSQNADYNVMKSYKNQTALCMLIYYYSKIKNVIYHLLQQGCNQGVGPGGPPPLHRSDVSDF